jgi:hypothetical protein
MAMCGASIESFIRVQKSVTAPNSLHYYNVSTAEPSF